MFSIDRNFASAASKRGSESDSVLSSVVMLGISSFPLSSVDVCCQPPSLLIDAVTPSAGVTGVTWSTGARSLIACLASARAGSEIDRIIREGVLLEDVLLSVVVLRASSDRNLASACLIRAGLTTSASTVDVVASVVADIWHRVADDCADEEERKVACVFDIE